MDTTVLKALTVLETLSRSREGRGVTELSQELGLTKANCHRLLRTLISAGYAVQDDDTKRYRLSLRMWEIGVAALDRLDLTETVHPHLQVLADAADESVQLATMDGDSIVYIDKADSRHPLRATTQVGSRVPAYCVSTGKALLAFTENALDRLTYPLTAFTATTITTRARMEREVTAIRRAGYAVNRGEWREGIWGIAAPVRDGTGVPVAAVGVWGPEVRFRGAAVTRLARHVLDAAQSMSVRLGYRGSESSSSKRKATAN